jgi:hypothetical protein
MPIQAGRTDIASARPLLNITAGHELVLVRSPNHCKVCSHDRKWVRTLRQLMKPNPGSLGPQ